MKIISHRGNLNGPNPLHENKISYIDTVLETTSFDVEVDVREKNGMLYLGHDGPQERLPSKYANNDRIWFHCKDFSALFIMTMLLGESKYFWHQTDDYTLTSNGKVWTFPGKPLIPWFSIAVLPEAFDPFFRVELRDLKASYGICTDYPHRYEELVK